MYITDFEYADKRLSDFGYIVCHINSDAGMRDVDIGCDITFNTIKNTHSSKSYITSSSYENVYTMSSFEIMKNPCGKENDEMYLTDKEISQMMMWLNKHEYRKFKLISSANPNMDICYYGSFNVKQKMSGDNIIGLSLTFTSNAPYGFSDEVSLDFDIVDNNEDFYIYGEGDEIGHVYPKMIIACVQDGDIVITNNTTGNILSIKNCKQDEIIYIDGELKIITTTFVNEHTTLYSDFNYEFLDINITDDDYSINEYTSSTPCQIAIKYSPIRKVGVY